MLNRSVLDFLARAAAAAAAQAQTAAPPQLTLAQALRSGAQEQRADPARPGAHDRIARPARVALSPLLPNVSGAAYQASLTATWPPKG